MNVIINISAVPDGVDMSAVSPSITNAVETALNDAGITNCMVAVQVD